MSSVAFAVCPASAQTYPDRPIRIAAVEQAVRGLPLPEASDAARAAMRGAIRPIDDVRSTAAYRQEVAENLVASFFSGILT